jgi:hypothetical protein
MALDPLSLASNGGLPLTITSTSGPFSLLDGAYSGSALGEGLFYHFPTDLIPDSSVDILGTPISDTPPSDLYGSP